MVQETTLAAKPSIINNYFFPSINLPVSLRIQREATHRLDIAAWFQVRHSLIEIY